MKSERQPLLVQAGEGHTFAQGLICRVTTASTLGAYCAFEIITPPGQGVPLHIHDREDEVYYILEGAYEIECAGRMFRAEAGALAVLPRRLPHSFRNVAVTPSRALTIFIPGGFDDFVAELNSFDAAHISSPTREAIRRKYGIQTVYSGKEI